MDLKIPCLEFFSEERMSKLEIPKTIRKRVVLVLESESEPARGYALEQFLELSYIDLIRIEPCSTKVLKAINIVLRSVNLPEFSENERFTSPKLMMLREKDTGSRIKEFRPCRYINKAGQLVVLERNIPYVEEQSYGGGHTRITILRGKNDKNIYEKEKPVVGVVLENWDNKWSIHEWDKKV